MILNGTEKSALLLMSIGTEQAGEILKNLTPVEVQELITAMVNIKIVSKEKVNQILSECYNLAINNNYFNYHSSSDSYLVKMLTQALGEKKGQSLLQEALEIRNAKICIEELNYIQAEKVAFLLKDEHPQIITTILIYLNKNQSAEILSFLTDKQRAEIILRITEFSGIEESSLIELNKVINNLLKNKKLILSEKGGIKSAARILKSMQMKDEKDTIDKIKKFDNKMAKNIIKEILSFENIVDLDDKHLELIIKNIEEEKIYIALQNASVDVKEKFFKNMSKTKFSRLSSMLEKKSYVSKVSIENEQKLVLIISKSILNGEKILLHNLREYYD